MITCDRRRRESARSAPAMRPRIGPPAPRSDVDKSVIDTIASPASHLISKELVESVSRRRASAGVEATASCFTECLTVSFRRSRVASGDQHMLATVGVNGFVPKLDGASAPPLPMVRTTSILVPSMFVHGPTWSNCIGLSLNARSFGSSAVVVGAPSRARLGPPWRGSHVRRGRRADHSMRLVDRRVTRLRSGARHDRDNPCPVARFPFGGSHTFLRRGSLTHVRAAPHDRVLRRGAEAPGKRLRWAVNGRHLSP